MQLFIISIYGSDDIGADDIGAGAEPLEKRLRLGIENDNDDLFAIYYGAAFDLDFFIFLPASKLRTGIDYSFY